jgi:AraC-like DNA-binding protein
MSKNRVIPDTVTVTIPFRVAKRGGRKEVQLPPGANNRSPDYTLIKAVARAYRWRKILEAGDMGTIAELAEHEKVSPSYLTRVMRLTLLAPDIIEAILDGNPPSIGLSELLDPMTPVWAEQRAQLGYKDR